MLVGDSTSITLSLDAIQRLGLYLGRDVEGMEERMALEAMELTVRDRALAMLAFRGRSADELARALVRKGAERPVVQRVIDRLREQGLLDDALFAQAYTRARVLGANHSRRRVQQDLARKGVARDVSDAAIAAVFDEEGVDQGALVEAAARKKLRLLATQEPVVRRRRLYAFLARRGYDGHDIRRAMEALGDEL